MVLREQPRPLLSGFMSGCFNVGLEFGKDINFGDLTDPMFRTLPATLLVTVGLYRVLCGGKLPPLAENMGLPTELYHIPVSLVSVHGYLHSPAAGGYHNIEIRRTFLRSL